MVESNTLVAYVPARLLDLLKTEPARYPNPPWEERLEGAVLFVDVSGFTPLSEVLTRTGAAGAEYLTDILNRSYEWLVAGVENSGGYVAHFNGDAITAIIPGSELTIVFQDAVHCGLDLIRAAYRHPPEVVGGVDFPLRVKVGISAGEIYSSAIGSHTEELRYFIAGEPVQSAALASSRCGPMQLLVPSDEAERLPPDVTTLEGPENHLVVLPALIKKVPVPVPVHRRRTRFAEDLPPLERLSRFVPAIINERLMLGLSDLVAEHRTVTVLFAEFEGVDINSPDCGTTLRLFMAEVFERVKNHGGTIDKVEQADKGNLIMALFGAPRALERADEAAMACALDLEERFSSSEGLRVTRIGINSGLVYAGGLGSKWRYDYTVMGDAVNVASRLLSAARPGEILVTERVRSRALDWEYGGSRNLHLKGKTRAVRVWPLEAIQQAAWSQESQEVELPERTGDLIGREAELYRLSEVIAALRSGKPSVVVIEGEMGLGKTRLAEHVAARVADFGQVLSQPFRPVVGVPYGHWQGPLTDLLDRETAPPATQLETFFREMDPEWVPWLCLFNPILGTSFPVTDAVERAQPTACENRLQEMVCHLLLHHAQRAPLLIVLDNFQDADNASIALLRRLASLATSSALMLLIAARSCPYLPSDELPGLVHLSLAPLDKPRLEMLVRKLAVHDVSDTIHDLIWKKSEGNPLFAEELLHTLRYGGLLKRTATGFEPASASALELPDSLRALLQSRIDELPEAGRAVAKVAAVIGTRFTLDTLAAGFKESLETGFLRQQLDSLIHARVLKQTHAGGTTSYEFRHVLSQEVIYSTMTQAQQEDLHRRLGAYLESCDEHVSAGILAHHFELGKDYPRAIEFHIKAAQQSMGAYANQEVIRGYERALDLADEQWLPLPEEVSRGQILESLGDVYFRIGAYRKAEGLFRKVRGIAANWLSVVRCLRKEGEARLRADDVSNALRCLQEALLLLKARRGWSFWGVGIPLIVRLVRDTLMGPPVSPGRPVHEADRDRMEEMDQVYAVLALAFFYEGRHRVVEAVFRMFQVALRLGEAPRIARAFGAVSFVYANLAFLNLARRYADAALEWLSREPDEMIQVQTRGTSTYILVGATARLSGDWDRAEELQLRSLAVSQSIGDVWEESVALMNLAGMWRTRGYHHRAIELHRRIMKLSKGTEPFVYLGEALVADGLCLAELGRFDEALSQIERALALPALQVRGRVRGIGYRGWIHYLEGRAQTALVDVDEAVKMISRERMVGDMVAEIAALRAEVLVASGTSGWKRWRGWVLAKRIGGRLPALQGSLAMIRGLSLNSIGREKAAANWFGRAVALHLEMDRGREAARALLWQAHLERKNASLLKERARALLKERGLPERLPGAPVG